MGTGPQPAVYANSTTGASNSHYMQLMRLVNLLAYILAADRAQFTTRLVFVNHSDLSYTARLMS